MMTSTRLLAAVCLLFAIPVAAAQDFDGAMSAYAGSVAVEYDSLNAARKNGTPVLRGKKADTYFAAKRARDARQTTARRAAAAAARRNPG